MKNLFIGLVMLIGFSFPQECDEPVNVWFKLSNDTSSLDYGKVIAIDMSKGYASTDGQFVYLLLQIDGGEDAMMITFPIGYWEVDDKIEKEFKSLEDYLKSKPTTEIQKQ